MAKQWAVRVTLVRNPKVDYEVSAFRRANVDLLITEIFRYAGTVDVVKGRDGGSELVFLIYRAGPDKGSETWADMNARRIQSFGIKAEKVEVGPNARLAI